MKVTSKTRKLLADVKKKCKARRCVGCPFWDNMLECRLNYPYRWSIDDWEEYKNEAD